MKQKIGRWIIPAIAGLAFIYLLVPIAYIFVFSFNDAGRTNLEWRGFTLDNWQNPCGAPAVCESLVNSLQVGVVATIVSTALGTCIAIGLVRYKFRFRKLTDVLIILPLATPEVVLGASLLAQFLNLGWELGYTTIVIAHSVFCMSFVIVTVRARVSSLDPRLEEAAADLYSTPRAAFLKVTFPLLVPGIVAAALLSFAMSFDDFIITNFNSGTFQTFPKFIYVAATRGIPAQANVIGSAMFITALLVVVIGQVMAYRKRKRLEQV
ncbi:ABC transporter permease [Arthrobacter sp. MYb211]|uniref:ABC transporter permease n=1 Tax=Micrococcaceae TaxID=1268 RepID=UPI000CFA9AD4|nr:MULTISPECIES: ABC transporter permease [unclassified Arthrobacter]PQZ99732.1 ABC transporter permease [Arthrobacter sp. MYb224]PRA06993.1 ABC transporter permease [Arthrobacter sp. MYb229]PRA11348.1 ABC transporter permease [Arthrobacter sp. MYb221]PRB53791.1 ABC transporter permease [Arthrobacter sp. MYb216]PRC07644.1 ABC transporter permease [Arthrobacter sp. MYb211]